MDELEISGKRYLSTRRAAKDHKYTSDYVGQLIRGGKVVGKKVGRSWYVSEESLNAYLSGEATPAVVALKGVVQEVKKEESAVAEATIPEPVAEVKVAEVKKEEPEEKREIEIEKTFEPVVVKTDKLEEHHIPIRTTTVQAERPMGGLHYITDDEPALPEIKPKIPMTTAPKIRVAAPAPVAAEVTETEDDFVEIIPNKRVNAFAVAGIALVGITTLLITTLLSANLNSHIVVEQGQVASVGLSFQ